MKRMAVPMGAEILDLCCGTGDWAFALNEAVGPTGQVTGVDFSEEMLTVAKEKAQKKQQTQIQWQTGNAMALSFPDEHFDYVTIGFGLRNVADRQPPFVQLKGDNTVHSIITGSDRFKYIMYFGFFGCCCHCGTSFLCSLRFAVASRASAF